MADRSSNLMKPGKGADQGKATDQGKAAPGGPADAELIGRWRGGEAEAFGELVMRYQDRLYNGVLRMCGNRDDAEELCQETFVKALEHLDGFRADSGFYTWLFRIGMNLTISRLRRGGKVKFYPLGPMVNEGDGPARLAAALPDDGRSDPAEIAAGRETHRRVLEALAELEPEYRAVVVLREMEDMDYGQISQVLGVPVGTVKSRLFRARSLLQGKLGDLM